jgi:hypothetical protein
LMLKYLISISALLPVRFPEQRIARRTDTISADLGRDLDDFRNKIHLESAVLTLSAQYESVFNNPFNLRLDSLTILARSDDQEIYLTDSTGSIYISALLTQGEISLHFNLTNSNLSEVINSIPDEIIISASYTIVGGNQTGTITNEDVTNIAVEINSRSVLAIEKSTISDTLSLYVSEEERDHIRNAQLSNFSLDILNAIPVQGWIKVDFLDMSRNYLFSLVIENQDSLIIQAARINIMSGEVDNPSITFRYIDLTADDIQLLAESYFVVANVSVETSAFRLPDPPLIMLRTSDWMKVNIYGRVKYRINLDNI